MRRVGALRLLSATFVLAALLLTVLPVGSSSAAEPITTGWWHRAIPLTGQSTGTAVIARIASSPAQVPPLPLPPPPTAPPVPVTVPPGVTIPDPGQDAPTPDPTPAGGLMVANDPTGPRAIAALRFDLEKAAGGILTLKVASGSTPAPAIRACPALSDWLAGPNQGWSRRPAHDCGRVAVVSNVAADGTTTFDLPDDFRDPAATFFDVVLVPAVGDGTPFQTVFDKPSANALQVTAELPEDDPLDDPLDDDFEIDFLPPASFDEFSFESELPLRAGSARDRVYTEPTANSSSVGRGRLRPAGFLENPTARRIAALTLVLLGGYAYWQSGQTMQRAPRLLGSLGGGSAAIPVLAGPGPSAPRGIGRFSRVRRIPAQRL